MKPSSNVVAIHDIKPLMEVPDSSFTFLMVILLVLLVLFSGVSYLLYRYFKKRKQINRRKENYKALESIDFSQPKRAAYDITEYGRLFASDSQRLYEAYQNLIEHLEPYKYKRKVDAIDEESRSYYKIYLEMIDV